MAGSVGVDLEIGPPLCSDLVVSGNESDVDCGHGCDTKCTVNQRCNNNQDCESALCSTVGTCVPPSCSDGLLSPSLGESDIDCAGICGTKCAASQTCRDALDCVSGRCLNAKCALPSCVDTILNQNEVDVDCGGSSGCPLCSTGMKCQVNNDCKSLVCLIEEQHSVGSCLASTCFDGVQNGGETCIDGGGSGAAGGFNECSKCAAGLNCKSDSDCHSLKCTLAAKCAVASAVDERKNNMETYVDCGGPNAPTCRVGQTCAISTDCESKHCNANSVCVQSTCEDGILNADESDVDCGGSRCFRCLDGSICSVGGDCTNSVCRHYISSTCKPADCDDGVLNGDETCQDGGGSCGATCSDGARCQKNGDCENEMCESGVCVAASCVDGVFQSATETGEGRVFCLFLFVFICFYLFLFYSLSLLF